MVIPCGSPACTAATRHSGLMAMAKKKQDSRWRVKIKVSDKDNAEYSPVYCASVPPDNRPPRYYHLPPSFSNVYTGIKDSKTGKIWGHAATGDLSHGDMTFDLVTKITGTKTDAVFINIDKIIGIPTNMKVGFFNTVPSRKWVLTDSVSFTVHPTQQQNSVLLGQMIIFQDIIACMYQFFHLPLYCAMVG